MNLQYISLAGYHTRADFWMDSVRRIKALSPLRIRSVRQIPSLYPQT